MIGNVSLGRLLALTATVASAACSDSTPSTAAPAPTPITAKLVLDANDFSVDQGFRPLAPRAQIIAGEGLVLGVGTTLIPDDPPVFFRLSFSGVANFVDSLLIASNGSVQGTIHGSALVPSADGSSLSETIALPIAVGSLRLTGTVRTRSGRTGTADTTLAITDSFPPTIAFAQPDSGVPTTARAGDVIPVSFHVVEDAALRYALVRVTGAFAFTDSIGFTTRTVVSDRAVSIHIPATVTAGTATISAEAMDVGGNVARAT